MNRRIHNLKLFFLSVFLLGASIGFSKEKTTYSGKKIVTPEEVVHADSSEAMRQDKNAFITAQPTALSPIGAAGVQAGYFLNPDQVVMLGYDSAKFEFLGFSTKTTVTSISYKRYHGNSFYWRGGLGTRTVVYEDDFLSLLGSNLYKFKGTANSIGLDFAIGNHWQWETFSMGCDWVGFFAPVTGSSSSSAEGNYSQTAYERDKKDMENLSMRGHAQLLKFYLGVAF